MKNRPSKQFINELKEKYKSPLKVEDILNKTDYFDNIEPSEEELVIKKQNHRLSIQKKSLITSYILVVFLLLAVITLTINVITTNNKQSDLVFVKDDSQIITQTHKDYMYNICDSITDYPVYCLQVNEQKTLYIYSGYVGKEHQNKTYYYFYIIHGINEYDPNVTIEINDNILYASSDKNYGLLLESSDEDVVLSFDVSFNDVTKHFYLED